MIDRPFCMIGEMGDRDSRLDMQNPEHRRPTRLGEQPSSQPIRSVVCTLALTAATSWATATEGAASAAHATMPAQQPDVAAIAQQILARADLQAGERVLLVARPGRFDGLIAHLRDGILRAGATDLGAILASGSASVGNPTEFARQLVHLPRAQLVSRLADVDLAVMLPDTTPADLVYSAMQDVLWQGRGRTIHFHWSGAYELSGNLRQVDAEVNAIYARVLRDTDYEALAATQRSFEMAMRHAEVRITTPAGTDLRFRIGDRPVTQQDGDASAVRAAQARNLIDREIELPAGAIRVAPLEETVQGTVAFPPSMWNSAITEGLVLTFVDGVVVSAAADSGLEAAEAVLRRGGLPARSFREFALGFNPLLAIPADNAWIPDYGYGAGVVRLSLGDNSELGGNVGGGFVRWNFFVDATVTVDGDIWVQNGTLLPR